MGATKFDIINNNIVQPAAAYGYTIPTTPAGTALEENLLQKYGKVMYYKVEFGLDPYNFTSKHYILPLENEAFDDTSEWTAIPDLINPTNLAFQDSFGGQMYFHIGNPASNEIIIDPETVDWRANDPRDTNPTGWRMFKTEYNHSWGMFTPNPTSNIAITFY